MVLGVAAPICGWLIAACVSSSIGAWKADGSSGSSSSSSSDRKAAGLGPGVSRRRRCNTRSRAGITRSISSSGTVGTAVMGGSSVIVGRFSSLSGVSTIRTGSSISINSSSSSSSSVSHSARRRVSASGTQALLARRRRLHLLPTTSSSRPFGSLGVHRSNGLSSSSSVFLSSSPSVSLSQRLAQVQAPAFSAAAAIASGSRRMRRRTRSMARTGDVVAKAVAATQQHEAVQVQQEQQQQPGVGEAEGEGRRRGLSEEKKTRRVVVTGMGVVSCLGHDPDTFYNNLLEGKSGVTTIQGFDASGFPTRIAGEIQGFDYQGYVHPKMAKRMDKYMWYLLTAGKKALEHAGIGVADARTEFDPLKCGVLIGSAMGGMQVFHDAVEALKVSYRRMNPFCIPFVTTNMGSAMLAMDLGWMGPNYSISTACATANYCILSAAQHIVRGEADVMLSGGSDAAVLPIGMGGFVACKALSKRNNEPSRASRPWDVDRDGFVMGEGAGVLVLEELEHAKARGATIYAEFLGGSFTCDAYHMTDPHPQGNGVRLCIERAMVDSGVKPEWVNYVNAHATSTPAGDLQEYKAIVNALGLTDPARRGTVRMNATKSMIGHLLGAAGAVEAIATVQAIRTGWLHPTLNVDTPEQDVDPSLLVRGEKQALKVKAALSNSFGFGGHNSSIIFAPYHPDGLGAYVESLEREEAAAAAADADAADASAGAGSNNGGL